MLKNVDIYYENVSGKMFDAVIPLLNHICARIPSAACLAYGIQTTAADRCICDGGAEKRVRARFIIAQVMVTHPWFQENGAMIEEG